MAKGKLLKAFMNKDDEFYTQKELGYNINHKAGWYIFLNYSQFGMCKLERKIQDDYNK